MVSEAELVLRTQVVEGGVEIRDLERVARAFGLIATAREATVWQIRELLREGSDVITYINRRVFDLASLTDLTPALRSRRIHAVVPIGVTSRKVTFHDPLPACRRHQDGPSFRGSAAAPAVGVPGYFRTSGVTGRSPSRHSQCRRRAARHARHFAGRCRAAAVKPACSPRVRHERLPCDQAESSPSSHATSRCSLPSCTSPTHRLRDDQP